MRDIEVISQTGDSCFIGLAKHSKTIKELGLRFRSFICFLVFGNPDETLTLVFEMLPEGDVSCSLSSFYCVTTYNTILY